MAEIYRARTRSVGGKPARWVALKMMRSTLGHEELRERLFEREVRIATRLNHPNVVPVYEFGQELGRPYLSMEYVQGRDLAHLLKPQGESQDPISFELGLYIGFMAARGLGHAHRLRDDETGERLDIVHRDVSPGNVMVGYDGSVKVLDFGVARINETQGFQTQTGTLRGKFAYMSPEQTLGEDLDARSDVFSFGTVLYELLTGTNCFRAGNPIETLERVQGMRPVPPSRALREIPKDVDRILAQCLSKDRRRRFPDGIALSEALGEYLDKVGFDGHPPLVEHMATTFSWEQHEEASELAREQEEVALMEVVDFVPDLTNDGLDSKHIAVSTEEEASSSEVRQMTVGDVGGAVFEDEAPSGALAPPPTHPLAEDLPLVRGAAVEASSLLATEDPAQGLAAPAGASTWGDDEFKPTAHTAISMTEGPPTPPASPWYRGPAPIAAAAAAAILGVAWILVGTDSAQQPPGARTTPTLAPVTIRLTNQASDPQPASEPQSVLKRNSPEAKTGRGRPAPSAPSGPPAPAATVPVAKRTEGKRVVRASASKPKASSRSKSRRRRRARKKQTGFLNVGARPWAEITINGKKWPYHTPQAGIELPVGKHVVVLHNPKTGVTKRTAVYIKNGKYRTVNLDLRRR